MDANFKPGTQARVIADSISPTGQRLTTIEVTFHRWVLAEYNTHRVFSRNSASSRAIPFPKQVERVLEHPALPVEWRQEQRGMQGGEVFPDIDAEYFNAVWLQARDDAVRHAQKLAESGVHKSIINRLLEPFMWHTAITTASEWDGFWHQRCSELAQPEIRVAAEAMREAYDASIPTPVDWHAWHLPYWNSKTDVPALEVWWESNGNGEAVDSYIDSLACAVSAARCARVSYLTHDGVRDIGKDIELYQRLITADPPHASPLEHVATPSSRTLGPGNFRGWFQLRHALQEDPYFPTLTGPGSLGNIPIWTHQRWMKLAGIGVPSG